MPVVTNRHGGCLFKVTGEQEKQAQKFMLTHDCSCRKDEDGWPYVGAIGGATTFCFTPTGLGDILVVKCTCGAEVNLTDFDSW